MLSRHGSRRGTIQPRTQENHIDRCDAPARPWPAALCLDRRRRHLCPDRADRRCPGRARRADRAVGGEFHWSRATISFAVGVNLLLYGLIGPFAAALIDRFGVRRTMRGGVGDRDWEFREPGDDRGLAAHPAVGRGRRHRLRLYRRLSRRLYRGPLVQARQGLVLGVLTAGNAAGQLVFCRAWRRSSTSAGWRAMSLTLAVFFLVFVPVSLWLMRDGRDRRAARLWRHRRRRRSRAARFRQPDRDHLPGACRGARSRDFWLIAGSYFVCGASTNGLIGTHLIPACVDHGLTEVVGAGLLAGDRGVRVYRRHRVGLAQRPLRSAYLLFWYYGLRGLSLMYLPFAFDMSFYGLTLFACFTGSTGSPACRRPCAC